MRRICAWCGEIIDCLYAEMPGGCVLLRVDAVK
jgi:hypothetical protein